MINFINFVFFLKKKDTISFAMQLLRSLRYWLYSLHSEKFARQTRLHGIPYQKEFINSINVTSFEKIVSLHHITISREFLIGML